MRDEDLLGLLDELALNENQIGGSRYDWAQQETERQDQALRRVAANLEH